MPIRSLLAALLLTLSAGIAIAQDKVVYHVDHAAAQGLKGLRNIRNHLDTAPDTKIVVVTHADGVDLLIAIKRRWLDLPVVLMTIVSAILMVMVSLITAKPTERTISRYFSR